MSKSKNKKSAKRKYNPSTIKEPRISPQASPESSLSKNPAWKFSLIDLDGPWGWGKIDSKECLFHIHDCLKEYERKIWSDIDDRRYNHPIPVYKISKEARTRLVELGLDEYDSIYRLRLSGLERVWGIREHESLYFLWWDPKHTVHPLYKKHT